MKIVDDNGTEIDVDGYFVYGVLNGEADYEIGQLSVTQLLEIARIALEAVENLATEIDFEDTRH